MPSGPALGWPEQSITRSAPKPPTMSRTRLMRSSASLISSMFTVASAPNLRASSSRGFSGAPTQITRPAPISRAAAMARMPIGPEPWITTVSPPSESAGADCAVERADARGQRLRQRAEPQRHVVGKLVDFRPGQHVEVDIDVFREASPQMRRLVEAEIAPVINRGQALVGLLRIMDAVIALPARHQRRDHHLRADAERLAHEIFGERTALFDDDAAELVPEGERPRQRLRPVAFEDVKVGAAHPAGADLNQRGVRGDLRPRHRPDDRLGAWTGEGGDANGAVAHGLFSAPILSRITAVPALGQNTRR